MTGDDGLIGNYPDLLDALEEIFPTVSAALA
jgi:hypothetical protein